VCTNGEKPTQLAPTVHRRGGKDVLVAAEEPACATGRLLAAELPPDAWVQVRVDYAELAHPL
jgi:hypothetical protein